MEQTNTPYEPLVRAPLKLRGVFGITWQLYKRGFWPMFALSFALLTLPYLLMMLLQLSMFSGLGLFEELQKELSQFGRLAFEFSMGDTGRMFGRVMAVSAVTWLLSMVYAFLITPAYSGALFMEMDQRMDGRRGTLYQLFRYAVPIGLKRFYTTYLSMFVVELGISMVMGLLFTVVAVVAAVSAAFSIFSPVGGSIAGAVTVGLVVLLLVLFIGAVSGAFLALIYPVAVREGKLAFSAVGRAFKLTGKRFGRMVGAMLLLSLVAFFGFVLLCLPLVFLWQNIVVLSIVFVAVTCLWMTLFTPYSAAFSTALYVDCAARVDAPAHIPPVQPQQSAHLEAMPEGWEDTKEGKDDQPV